MNHSSGKPSDAFVAARTPLGRGESCTVKRAEWDFFCRACRSRSLKLIACGPCAKAATFKERQRRPERVKKVDESFMVVA